MERHILEELKMLKNTGVNVKMSSRKNLNFSEYQFKGNYNRCCNFPNAYGTSLNNNIKSNFSFGLQEVKNE